MNLGLLIIRLAVGLLFVGHGAQKLFGSFGGHGPAGTAAFFESQGMRPGRVMALFAGAAEVAGGALFAAGLLTPVGAALISAVMVTAMLTVHAGKGLWATEGGVEYNLVLIAAAFAVTAIGAGDWSLDHALGLHLAGVGWAVAELAVALAGGLMTIAIGRSSLRSGAPGRRTAGGVQS
jgi:putative oxidoreductase